MTHAINLIDGLNGLSSAVVIAITVTFGLVAHKYGHADLMVMNAVVCVAFIGFMCVNFPNGRVFLGDAGAYSIGHIIAWNAIVLTEPRARNISLGNFVNPSVASARHSLRTLAPCDDRPLGFASGQTALSPRAYAPGRFDDTQGYWPEGSKPNWIFPLVAVNHGPLRAWVSPHR